MTEEIKARIELINKGKVPEGYKRTKVGIVPCGWGVKKLKDLAKYKTNKNKGKQFNVTLTNSANLGIIMQSQYFEKEISNYDNIDGYYIVDKGDYVYNPRISVAAPCGPINKSHIQEPGVVSPLYTVFKFYNNTNIYYEYYFHSSFWYSHMYEIANYGARSDRMNVTNNDFFAMPLPAPPLPEQQKIAEILTTYDKLIALKKELIAEKQELKKSCLSKMFPKNGSNVPEVRFPGFSGDWERRTLGEIGETYTGLSGKTKEDFGHGNAHYITYMNVFSNTIADKYLIEQVEIDKKQNEVKCGDVLFTTSSETPNEVGMSAVWLENVPNIYLNSFCFGYRPHIEINGHYLAYYLRAESFRSQITLLAQGISRYNISKTKTMELHILLPQIEEQTAIGTFFKTLDNLINLHQRELEEMEKQKKALMQLLLTGIVRVN